MREETLDRWLLGWSDLASRVLDWHGRKTVHAPLYALSKTYYAADTTADQAAASIGFILEERGQVQYILLNARCCKRDASTS